MKKERSNIQLSSYDDIFGDNKAAEVTADQVVEIP